ncbi:unnamed protein product [Prunus armeniaca]|uniref:Uncharacterized protein n=1 Tax=Prunus armeniaca TaxID=36596 RepID=A0A6J5TZ60_PRUAR|nr:unnamed protein product [Prunus armeniaca]
MGIGRKRSVKDPEAGFGENDGGGDRGRKKCQMGSENRTGSDEKWGPMGLGNEKVYVFSELDYLLDLSY